MATMDYDQLRNLGGGYQIKGNSIALFGHSIINYNKTYDQTGNPPTNWGRGDGPFNWANALLGQRFEIAGIYGHDGFTVAQLKSYVDEVITSGADYVLCMWGHNSIYQEVSFASYVADATYMLDAFRRAGLTVILCTDWASTALTTANQKNLRQQINNWIVSKSTDPGIIVVPIHHVIADPTTGSPITGALADGTHPFTYGSMLVGKAIADILGPIIPSLGGSSLVESNVEPNNALTNGMFTGTTGTLSGATATGVVATGYQGEVTSGSHVCTFSKVARADGRGEWQQMSFTGTAGTGLGTKLTKNLALPAGWENSTVYFELEVESDNASLTALEVYLFGYTTGFGAITQSTVSMKAASGTDTGRTAFKAVIRTPELVLLPNTVNFSMQVGLNALATPAAVLRIGRAAIRKV